MHFLMIPVWLVLAAIAMPLYNSVDARHLGGALAAIVIIGYLASAMAAFGIFGVCPNCKGSFYFTTWGRANPFAIRCSRCRKEP